MDREMKRRLLGIATVLSVVVASYCLYRMIPYGLAGNISKVRHWFAVMIFAIVGGLVSMVMYYYLRARDEASEINKQYNDLETLVRAKTPEGQLIIYSEFG